MKSGFYEARLAPIVCDLTQVVVSLGLISVSLGYVSALIGDSSLLGTGGFWLRILLLLATVCFTCYSLLGYVADLEAKNDTAWGGSSRSPSLIIGLFLIDLVMLGLQGWMYGVLVLADPGRTGTLALAPVHLVLLGLLAALWHATTFIWHLLSGSRLRSQRSHLSFCAAFLMLAGLAFFLQPISLTQQWLWSIAYGLIIMVLFFTRGRTLVRSALGNYPGSS